MQAIRGSGLTVVRAVERVAIPNHDVSMCYAHVIGKHSRFEGWLTVRVDSRRLRDLLRLGLQSPQRLRE